jgi:hypothetical protein
MGRPDALSPTLPLLKWLGDWAKLLKWTNSRPDSRPTARSPHRPRLRSAGPKARGHAPGVAASARPTFALVLAHPRLSPTPGRSRPAEEARRRRPSGLPRAPSPCDPACAPTPPVCARATSRRSAPPQPPLPRERARPTGPDQLKDGRLSPRSLGAHTHRVFARAGERTAAAGATGLPLFQSAPTGINEGASRDVPPGVPSKTTPKGE